VGETADTIEPESDKGTAVTHNIGDDGNGARGHVTGADSRRLGEQRDGAYANIDNAHSA
jgi:hypothetical protein